MKRLFILFSIITSVIAVTQAQTEINEIENYTYGTDVVSEECHPLPYSREITGGTIILCNYVGDWTEDMKGAFEYACKIWEETLPSCPPIKVTAKLGKIRGAGNGKTISKVNMTTLDLPESGPKIALSRIKNVLLQDFNACWSNQFYNEISSKSIMDLPDFSITYNTDCLDEISFAINENPIDKYDFVTIVLRDIARGLGFGSSFTANPTKEELYLPLDCTPFESHIRKALNYTTDASTAYTKATQGILPINIDNYGTLALYAPNPWENGMSLNFFIPDSLKPITELLTYNFNKGLLIRDIADSKYDALFRELLYWKRDIVVGPISGGAREEGSTDNMLPFKGNFTMPFPSYMETSLSPQIKFQQEIPFYNNFNSDSYCYPYSFFYSGETPMPESITIAILLKDGSWDLVYNKSYSNYFGQPLDIDALELNFPIDDYARTADGCLKYRFAKFERKRDYLYNRTYYEGKVVYYARTYLPQRISFGFSKIHDSGSMLISSFDSQNDDFLIDIEVAMKNLEGTTRVVVEQLDYGERVPFAFEVEDFQKGYFIATVDKEFPTKFTVIAYNQNGTTRSNLIEIPPLFPTDIAYSLKHEGNQLQLTAARRTIPTKQLHYDIRPLTTIATTATLCGETDSHGMIDISELTTGMYVLSIRDGGNTPHSYKFIKR